jgi:hypothetical protein
VALGLCACLALGASPALAVALPDGRAYEMVTPLEKDGLEVGEGVASVDGNALNWQAPGGCCSATSAGQTLYQSTRTSDGWQTQALTPTPTRPLVGLTEEQTPVFWTGDLSQTIFSTPVTYAAGDERPGGAGALDLYLRDSSGSLSWLSQGPFPGSGSAPDTATFDGATPDAGHVLFSSAAQLTPEATGISSSLSEPGQYLYERDVAEGTTKLINVVTTTLAAAATGQLTTTLAADAHGTTTSELTVATAPTDSSLTIASTAGFFAGQTINVGERHLFTVTAVTDATHLALSAPVGIEFGAGTNIAGFGSGIEGVPLTVASTAGMQVGGKLGGLVTVKQETLEDVESPSEETATIASIVDGTHLMLTNPLANEYAAGTPVHYEGDPSIAVADTTNFYKGQQIAIDTGAALETATVASVPDATHLALSAGLTHSHAADAQVTGVVNPVGATLGNGSYLGHSFLPANTTGTTTHAISSDGSKIFFESPPPGLTPPGGVVPPSATGTLEPHLYMRNESNGTTTALDDTTSGANEEHIGSAHFEGATPDGSLVFFTSNEGLAGEPTGGGQFRGQGGAQFSDNELYEFNTTDQQIGTAPPMSAVPVSGGSLSFSTSLAAEARGKVGTTAKGGVGTSEGETQFAATEGATSIPVVSSAGFFPGEMIHVSSVDIGSSNGEECPSSLPHEEKYEDFDVTITGALDATHLALAEPLPPGHCVLSRGPVTYEGDTSLALHTTAGVIPGEILEIEEGERVTVESITDATHVALRSPTLATHPAGATVTSVKFQDGSVIGVTAISNDGSHVYFVAENILVTNTNPQGQQAVSHKPNLYVFDTASGQTTFIATLAATDVNNCLPNCTEENPYQQAQHSGFYQGAASGLVAEPDVDRPAVPTPDGSVLVFDSSGNLTGQDPGPATMLSDEVEEGEHTLTVASTAGFAVGHTITIGTGSNEEIDTIESIPDATHLVLTANDPAGMEGTVSKHAAGEAVTQLHSELYRYDTADNSLTCISCTPAGVIPTGNATLGGAGGGSYGPPMTAVPMNESGTEIFFQTPDPLVSEDVNGGSFADGPFGSTEESTDVYEWENGKVSLISDGRTTPGATLDGTTPSGNDVFITTPASLVSSDTDGFNDIYDARVGGGLPQPPAPPTPCKGTGCRAGGASVFFALPGSSTLTGAANLTPLSVAAPSFTVGAITAAQRARSARSGKLTLSVSATAAGKLSANVFAVLHGRNQRVGSASVTLGKAGKVTLTLHLNKAARKALAKSKKLALRIEVSYSGSALVKVAKLTLRGA